LKDAQTKLKELEMKKSAYERSLTGLSKEQKKLDAEISAQVNELKKLKSAAMK